MVGFTARIEGLKELDAKLAELAGPAAKRILRDGLDAGGKIFQAAVMARAPERPVLPSGNALPPGALKLDIEVVHGKADGLPAVIVEPGFFTRHAARWVEYGHRLVKGGYSKVVGDRRRGPGHEIGNVPAHPFIRPGYEAAREAAVGATVMMIAHEIEAAAAKRKHS
jgi:hypothetical protein